MRPARPLEDHIIAALTQALAEGRTDAAEHLLRAVETLCSDATPGSVLADAYGAAFGSPPTRLVRRILRQ
ncbi:MULTISPECIES: hypothetical protein [Roseicella]|uniref:Uncharacterized protein n=1 Tax=Roseicella aquatilis TaxID=2527868 RepID=A0A4R4D6W7_9PROT|nr:MULTISPECIES: hypothetical protein [Roseicella]NOG73528.1 hypothetical protein [Roseicella sp. DB1501]TCZ55769.1 hypothetical protein EXY23_20785 [Roseicella aquatilis]